MAHELDHVNGFGRRSNRTGKIVLGRPSKETLTERLHQLEARRKEVIKMCQEGKRIEEIAGAIGCSRSNVYGLVRQLNAEGLITNPAPRSRKKYGRFRNINDPRVQIVIEMKKRRATLEEIGQALGGCTIENARQLIKNIKSVHGEGVFNSEEKYRTTREAAAELHISESTVRQICEMEGISLIPRGEYQFLIGNQGFEELREHPVDNHQQVCKYCGEVFVKDKSRHGGMVTCCEKCFKDLRARRRLKLISEKPTADSLRGWALDLWITLEKHRRDENPRKLRGKEKWIGFGEAKKLTGLSHQQVSWLRQRHIVTIHRHPTKMGNGGEKAALYAVSEMEIAKKIYAEFLRKRNAGD